MSDSAAFSVMARKGAGRAIVTARDLEAQEILLSEAPAQSGASLTLFDRNGRSASCCIECLKMLSEECEFSCCSWCSLPVCKSAPQCGKDHAKNCRGLHRRLGAQLDSVTAAACLNVLGMARMRKRKSFKVVDLMSSSDSCPVQPPIANLRDFLVKLLSAPGVEERFSAKDVDDAIGVFAVNGVKVQRSAAHVPCVAVYSQFSMANHSCISTAKYTVSNDDFRMKLQTKCALKRNREVTISYLDPLMTTPSRQRATKERWGFACGCPRCRDPTEFGTCASGIRCPLCSDPANCRRAGYPEGVAVPLDPLNPTSLWKCLSCGAETEGAKAGRIVEDFDARRVSTSDDPEHLERTLFEASLSLGADHAVVLAAEFRLAHLYYGAMTTTAAEGRHKNRRQIRQRLIHVCLHLLEVVGVLDPGFTRWRGMVLQSFVVAWLDLAKEDAEHGRISKTEFKARVATAMRATQEAVACLKFDPKNCSDNFL